MSPRISIVTPNYNQGRFIEETMHSVLSQDYPNLEYIVIDGGSHDESLDVIGKYADRLAYFVSEPDAGHGDALNKGFAQASGDIMAWLNSDDKYLPWTFKAVAEVFMMYPDIEWLVGKSCTWNAPGYLTHAHSVYKNIHDFIRDDYQWIQQESVFWRRSLWDKAGGYVDQDYKLMVDGELWTRFFLHAELFHVECMLGGYRNHGANRALLNMAACHGEMRRATHAMRESILARRITLPDDRIQAVTWDYGQHEWRRAVGTRGAGVAAGR